MIRPLALSALALLALDGLTTAIAPATGVSLTSEAAAADFTGRIKTIRIRKRRVGSSYSYSFWVRPTGKSASWSSAPAGGSLTLTDTATGAVVEQAQLGTPFHGTAVGSATSSSAELGGSIDVVLEVEEDGVASSPSVRVDLSQGRGDGASDDGWKATATLTPQGELRVVVLNEDRDWDGSTLTGLSVTAEDGTALPLDLDGGGSSLKANVETDLDAYSTLTATVTLVDADGNELETTSQDFEFEGTGAVEETPLQELSLSSSDAGFVLTTWTVDDGTEQALEVELADAETDEAPLMTTDDTPVVSQGSFATGPLAFEATPDGATCLVDVALLNAEGKQLDSQTGLDLTVPKYDGQRVGTDYALFDDKTGAVGLLQGEDGLYAQVVDESEQPVASAVVSILECSGGVRPVDSVLALPEVARFSKWVQAADADLPSTWALTVSVVTAEGEAVQTTTTTGTGTGTVYERNGKGTKKAATQTSQQHFALL